MNIQPATTVFRFLLLGEPLSLDRMSPCIRRGTADVDPLDESPAPITWLAAEAGRQPRFGADTAADLQVVRALRDAIAARDAQQSTSAPFIAVLRTVNKALSTSASTTRLVWASVDLRIRVQAVILKRSARLYPAARMLPGIAAGPQAKLLCVCEHPDRVLQVLARNLRPWCSLATGYANRARVARHYHRRRSNGR